MLSVKRYRCAIFSIWLTFFISPAQAEAVDGWQFSLAAGHGKISTVLSGRRPISGNFIPGVSYYGERFYLENTHLGYSLVENDYGYIDLVGELNDDGMFFELDGVNKFGWWDAIGIGRTDGGESRHILKITMKTLNVICLIWLALVAIWYWLILLFALPFYVTSAGCIKAKPSALASAETLRHFLN